MKRSRSALTATSSTRINIGAALPGSATLLQQSSSHRWRSEEKAFCCTTKQYLCYDDMFAKSIEIIPRVVIYKKSLKLNERYQQVISISNNGLHPRKLSFHTDSSQDLMIKIPKEKRNKYLGSDESISITVVVVPHSRQLINRRRNIYIESEHPNIIFEVPVVVLAIVNADEPSVPRIIRFPTTVPEQRTHYEFAIYNPTSSSKGITIKSLNKLMEGTMTSTHIRKKDYILVALTLWVSDYKIFKDELKIRVGDLAKQVAIQLIHTPCRYKFFLSRNYVKFEELGFTDESSREFTICNDSASPIQFQAKFFEDASSKRHDGLGTSFETNLSKSSMISSDNSQEELPAAEDDHIDYAAFNNFTLSCEEGEIPANTAKTLTIKYHPEQQHCHFRADIEPPFTLRTKITFFAVEDHGGHPVTLVLEGSLRGPEASVTPKVIDFRKIYMGEEHCEHVDVHNLDEKVPLKICFSGSTHKATGHLLVKPNHEIFLGPEKSRQFHISFYTRTIGVFAVKARFKVRNGKFYDVLIRGYSTKVSVKLFPDMLEYGSIPVAIPQKRLVLLMNPLSVPLTVQCVTTEDGVETPLVLNVRDVDDFLPITIKNPRMRKEDLAEDYSLEEEYLRLSMTEAEPSEISFRSVEDITSEYSSRFEEQILEPIKDFAHTVVCNIRKKRILERTEVEKRILDEALEALYNTDYFDEFKKYSNYAQMDFNSLPTDPKEIYCDQEVIYLNPNAGKSVTVVLIPNNVGYNTKCLEIRVCPINEGTRYLSDEHLDGIDNVECKTELVSSELMVSKLWLEYTCRTPELRWDDTVTFPNRSIYAGGFVDFEMEFENLSLVGGFIYYDILPKCDKGEMEIFENVWKFFIYPEAYLVVQCRVLFRAIGTVKLSGLLKILGVPVGMPFHVVADVLPPAVNVAPRKIYRYQKIMETSRVYVFIENIRPIRTWVTMRLKSTSFQRAEPNGTILGPNGNGTYVVITSKFYDPGQYHNILLVTMQFGDPIEIPVDFHVTGVPVIFTPDVKDYVNMGNILTNSVENFYADIPNYSQIIRTCNTGKRPYRVHIKKLKSAPTLCAEHSLKGRLGIEPKSLYLNTGDCGDIRILANACEEMNISNEFRILIQDQVNKKRIHNISFRVQARFMEPELSWSRREIKIEYRKTHRLNERLKIEVVQLTNIVNVRMEVVTLKASGPIKIKELFEKPSAKELNFSMEPLETKDIIIVLQKGVLKYEICGIVDGRVSCLANQRPQRPLLLKVAVLSPVVEVIEPFMMLFTKKKEQDIYIGILNQACMDAQYRWRKIKESRKYISEVDNVEDFIEEILFDILDQIRIADEFLEEFNIFSRPNLTVWYHKHHCWFDKDSDYLGVTLIIDEIIENLDLDYMRYHVDLDKICNETCMKMLRKEPSEVFLRETLTKVIDALKLEDSTFEITAETAEECYKEHKIYFYEASSMLLVREKRDCLLHLPAVRPGYKHKASFELEVVGGVTQKFVIALVNLDKVIKLAKDSIYLGVKPWYELFKSNTRVSNITNYEVNIRAQTMDPSKGYERISRGFVNIVNPNRFIIPQHGHKMLRVEGIMGFSDEFQKEVRLTINNGEQEFIKFRGQGIMPILSVTSKLARPDQNYFSIADDYKLLQRIYFFDIFKGITEVDEELPVGEETSTHELNDSTVEHLSQYSSSVGSSTSAHLRFFKMVMTYEMVHNNAELPNALVLEQLLETEKFKERLSVNQDTQCLLHMVYNDYVKMMRAYDEKMPINLKHFMTQPLPHEQLGYVLNMNQLHMNRISTYTFDMQFFGPGKLIASARTAVKIPGLSVDFIVKESADKEFIYYSSDDKAPDFFDKPYRNMYERIIDLEKDPKLKHAHSFDIDKNAKHLRQISSKERQQIRNYYNSLNKSVYMEHKHHYTLCKIFSNSKHNFASMNFKVKVLIKPQPKFYDEGQLIEDYIYIDLHLGATMPVLMRGLIGKAR